MTRFNNLVRAAAAALSVCTGTMAWAAPETNDIQRLLQAGQTVEALQRVNQHLASKPKDAQLRFIKGVIVADQGKTSEAIAIFTSLTEDFPELPEPHNNLAVLYSQQGKYEQARRSLENAIRTNPSYATAYENLGDVYAKLASQAYSKALQINGDSAAVPPKLALIRELFTVRQGSRPTATVATSAPAPATLPAQPKPSVTVAAAPSSAAAPPAVAAKPAQAASPATSAPPPRPSTPTHAAVASTAAKEVEAAVHAWASAWSRRDLPGYFAAYTRNFSGTVRSRKEWENDRRARIASKRSISVTLTDLKTQVQGDTATVSFRQDYRADTLKVSSRKTLELVRGNGRWLIQKESTGS